MLLAAAYEGVVVYADQQRCWDLLSCPKFYYMGIMELTRWDHFSIPRNTTLAPYPNVPGTSTQIQQPVTAAPFLVSQPSVLLIPQSSFSLFCAH